MTMINPERTFMQKEEAAYGAAVTEALLSKLGAQLNFLNLRHHETKRFTINGNYDISSVATLPYNAIDGLHVFEFDCEILNIWIYNREKGTAGTTQLDLKWKSSSGSSWASIFSTLPSFTTTASNFESCSVGESKTGFVAPVLSKTNFNAGDMIRMDLNTCMTGNPKGCGIILNYRPR